MKIPKHPTLIHRHLQARIKEFKLNRPFVAASLVDFRRKCGRHGCHCHSCEGHLAHRLGFNAKGKTWSVYAPKICAMYGLAQRPTRSIASGSAMKQWLGPRAEAVLARLELGEEQCRVAAEPAVDAAARCNRGGLGWQ